MTMKTSSIVTISRSGRRTHSPHPDRCEPDPAPVIVVRAANAAAVARTPVQRARHTTARRWAAEATDAARRGAPMAYHLAMRLRVAEVPQASTVLREAVVVEDPPAGAVEVGRDGRGRPVAVVVRGETWSLVIRPAGDHRQPAASSAYFDEWVFDVGSSHSEHLALCFDTDPSAARAEWSIIIDAILAATI